jgi:biopolymer transport protein ExbB
MSRACNAFLIAVFMSMALPAMGQWVLGASVAGFSAFSSSALAQTETPQQVQQTPASGETVVTPLRPGPMSAPVLHDLSPWSMFTSADIIVQGVMVGLAFASLVTWTIFLAKSVELAVARSGLRRAIASASKARTLADAKAGLNGKRSVLATLLAAAEQEAHLSSDLSLDSGIKERAASHFAEIVRSEGSSMRRGMGLLATIGSTAPFVGLFGTVWGIMNSFIGISKSQTTNLAVVAPGIAEALLATAIGLVAAIPAVILYNYFSRGTKAYGELVGAAAGLVQRLLSRDLDRAVANTSV